jgi:Icc-related predicted phosphoesterase
VYAETTSEVDALEAGLEAVAGCQRVVVLLHYAPIPETLVGEPETIWAFLGSSRLAAPIGAHRPDLVLHGHAHRGSLAGSLGPVPVRNVAVHVLGKDFELFEL